jgi:DNA-binding transcriptional LysR family regulator
MNINHLRFVRAVSEKVSFSAAAKVCNVTQPTLSNGISKLEEELGEKIFERSTRSVKLTPFGHKIIPSINSILDLEDSIYLTSKEFNAPKTNVVKIGLSPLLNTKFVSMLTKTFTQMNKNQKIILIEQDLDSLESKFNNHELDIIFIPKIKKVKTANSLHLYNEELVYLESNSDQSSNIKISQIKDKVFLMVPDTCGLSSIVRGLFGSNKKHLNEYEGKAMSYEVLAEWALCGLGSAILPLSKVPSGTHVQKLISNKSEVTELSFMARWKPQDLTKLRPLISHFKQNSKDIYKGLSQ